MDYHQSMAGPKLPDFIIFLIYGGAIALSAIAAAGSGGDILEVSADGHEYAFSLSEDGFHSFDGPPLLPAKQSDSSKLIRRRSRCDIGIE